jgi:hypothetical protein
MIINRHHPRRRRSLAPYLILSGGYVLLLALLRLCGVEGQHNVTRPAAAQGQTTAAQPLPTDPWQRYCATVDRSKLRLWERQWLDRTPRRVAKVWTTNYGPWDPQRYKGDDYHIASNVLPKGTVVWLTADQKIKVVTNRGANWNDKWAQAAKWKGKPKPVCEFWIDRFTFAARHDNDSQTLYVLGRAPWPH